jgi:hypothetical protein
MEVAKEYTNSLESPRFRTLRSAFSHFKFYFPSDRPMDSYIRARRALLSERGISGAFAMGGQGPGRASHRRANPALPQ